MPDLSVRMGMMHRQISTFVTALWTASCAAVLATPSAAQAGGTLTAPPGNLRVTGVTYESISLAWEPSSGSVAYYQILRNGIWVNSSYGTTGSVRYLSAGTTYTLEVRARDWPGNVSASAKIAATTAADTGPPTIPENLRVLTDTGGAPAGMAWDASTDDRGIAGYWLLADGFVVFNGGREVSFFDLTDIECTLLSGQTYTFTAVARDLSGHLSTSSSPTTVTVP